MLFAYIIGNCTHSNVFLNCEYIQKPFSIIDNRKTFLHLLSKRKLYYILHREKDFLHYVIM